MSRLIGLALAATLAFSGTAAAGQAQLGECLWQRNDPLLLNVLYPDAGAIYYTVRLPAIPGVSYRLRGAIPLARYWSFVSYNGIAPIDALLDADIPPDPGSPRAYSVRLVASAPPAARAPGALYVGGGPTLQVIYRVYVPDPGAAVPVPSIVADGLAPLDLRKLACPAARQGLGGLFQGVQDVYANASLPVALPPIGTAMSPPEWTVESGLTSALLGRAGQGDVVSGGPASNPHNRYLAATVSRGHGEVLAIRGKAPTAPGQLRYWSFCQNGRTTRYVACLADYEFELDADGWYTLAISDPAKRPPGARNWLPFGLEPDGQVLYRHMLPSADFLPHSAQGVAASGKPIAEAMGDYYPRAAYCSRARFELDACGLD